MQFTRPARNRRLTLILCIFFMFAMGSAHAKRFANGYTEFELPNGWSCAIEGSEWVCQSENKDRQKEAIIILAAKQRGPQDTLSEYEAYLKKDKTYQLPGGKVQKSEPKYAKSTQVNNHTWVDALHLASEVPGFYTRYLATVKEDIGVAVTFSVTKDMYDAYKGIFDNVVASLRVFRQAKTRLADLGPKGSGDANFADTTFVPEEAGININGGVKERKKDDGGGDNTMLILLAAGALGVGFLLKAKGGKKKKGKKKS